MRASTGATGLTSAISEAPVVTHRAEVLEDKDSHGGDNQQHHEHHNPHVSTERLWGREKPKIQAQNYNRTNKILVHLHIHLLRQHVFCGGGGGETKPQVCCVALRCVSSESQGLGRGGVTGCVEGSPLP